MSALVEIISESTIITCVSGAILERAELYPV